jgi:hypothetical protein
MDNPGSLIIIKKEVKMNKKILTLIALCLVIAISVNSMKTAYALGVTSPYYDGSPLTLYPGETKEVSLALTNMVGNDNLTLVANVTKGADIAHLVDPDKQYFVPLGSNNNIAVSFVVSAPSTAAVGTAYNVQITLTTVTSGVGGGVVMGSSIGKDVPILVVSQTPTEKETAFPTWIIIVIIVIILLLILWIIFSKKKK